MAPACSAFDQPQEFRGLEGFQGRAFEILHIPRDDAIGSRLFPGPSQNGIFKIRHAIIEGGFNHRSIHGRDVENPNEAPQGGPRRALGYGPRQKLFHRGQGDGAQAGFNPGLFGKGEQRRGSLRMGFSIQEDVQHHVGVQKDFQRYFSRRCFR